MQLDCCTCGACREVFEKRGIGWRAGKQILVVPAYPVVERQPAPGESGVEGLHVGPETHRGRRAKLVVHDYRSILLDPTEGVAVDLDAIAELANDVVPVFSFLEDDFPGFVGDHDAAEEDVAFVEQDREAVHKDVNFVEHLLHKAWNGAICERVGARVPQGQAPRQGNRLRILRSAIDRQGALLSQGKGPEGSACSDICVEAGIEAMAQRREGTLQKGRHICRPGD